ncbi:hypothetical protein DFQ27_005077 [Actinomortierella ambigua]|uniref:Putative lipoate-protein ligase A n=1 Tax=Actinomortierella ambigua TaxID=1343610 RepID=A0A9P6Q1W2_9FUNG|nr:hypothetical protein DFQ27_005077 [Actinomortierella ambigua]
MPVQAPITASYSTTANGNVLAPGARSTTTVAGANTSLPFSKNVQGNYKVETYLSKINDPWTNLAFEEWKKSECNLKALARDNVPFVRRKSGGGTVYHDMGNTNYSIMMPRAVFDRKTNVELVCRALHELDIPAIVNDRHDIVLEGRKVSGSAYKLIQHRSYHHGTMLIDTDLTTLGQYLKCERETLVTKGVASFRSPVTRLRDHSFTIDHLPFCEAVRDEFLKRYAFDRWRQNEEGEFTIIDEAYIERLPAVQKLRDEMKTWDWVYGQTPEFTYTMDKVFPWGSVKFSLKSKEGKFVKVDVETSQAIASFPLTALCVGMEGLRYDSDGLDEAVKRIEEEAPEVLCADGRLYVQQVVAWLKEAL